MMIQPGFAPAPLAAPAVLAAMAFPLSSDTDHVSPYLRRPLRPPAAVERARSARASLQPAPHRDHPPGKSERRGK